MKTSNKLLLTLTMSVASVSFASPFGGIDRDRTRTRSTPKPPTIVSWVGEIKDESMSHTTEHYHSLEFTNKETGKSYDVVESPELTKIHCETGKNYLVKIEAELTPRVLFWGNNLIVKSFAVLDETSPEIAHQKPVSRIRSSKGI